MFTGIFGVNIPSSKMRVVVLKIQPKDVILTIIIQPQMTWQLHFILRKPNTKHESRKE